MRREGPAAPLTRLPVGAAVVRLFTVPDQPSEADLELITADERRRAARYRFPADRSAFVTTRAAARRCIASELGIAPHRVRLIVEPTGRPRLAEGIGSDLDFNLSHSGSLAAVAIARGRRVGVDVEFRRPDRGLESLVPDIMGPLEREMLAGLDRAEFVRAFYACWTRKEAIVKGLGAGLSYPVATLDIPTFPRGGVVRLPAASSPTGEDVWSLRTLELPGSFTLSIAIAGIGWPIVFSHRPDQLMAFAQEIAFDHCSRLAERRQAIVGVSGV